MNLADAKIKEKVIVKEITGRGNLRRRLMEMGITRGTTLYIDRLAPLGDPINIKVRDYSLSLRKDDASCIIVEEKQKGDEITNEYSFSGESK